MYADFCMYKYNVDSHLIQRGISCKRVTSLCTSTYVLLSRAKTSATLTLIYSTFSVKCK